jgi:hypothetical protein
MEWSSARGGRDLGVGMGVVAVAADPVIETVGRVGA